MLYFSGDMTDVVSAILMLGGARITDGIPRWLVHAILWRMQREEPLLSRLRFSITGDVCYSRDIDAAIDNLLTRGRLQTASDGAIRLGGIPTLRSLGHATRVRPHLHELLSASRTFHRRVEEWMRSARREVS